MQTFFFFLNYQQTIHLLIMDNHLTEYKQMSSGSFKNVTYKLLVNISYIIWFMNK